MGRPERQSGGRLKNECYVSKKWMAGGIERNRKSEQMMCILLIGIRSELSCTKGSHQETRRTRNGTMNVLAMEIYMCFSRVMRI